MRILAEALGLDPAKGLLIGGTAALYIAARSAASLVPSGAAAPGRRALASWLPIAAVAVVATLMKQAEIAVAVVFGTSVASLSLVLGAAAFAEGAPDDPGPWRRVWPFVLPAALLALLAGLSGRLLWWHALVFAAEGAVLLPLWLDRPALAEEKSTSDSGPHRRAIRSMNALLAVALGAIGAWLAVRGAVGVAHDMATSSTALITSTTLAPLLVIALIVDTTALARDGRASVAVSSTVGTVLLNLCVLLPAIVLLWYPISTGFVPTVPGIAVSTSAPSVDLSGTTTTMPATSPATKGSVATIPPASAPAMQPQAPRSFAEVSPMTYPMVTWRVDTVLLVLLGFLLLPISLGRWRLGRVEGMALIALYAIYVLAIAAAETHL